MALNTSLPSIYSLIYFYISFVFKQDQAIRAFVEELHESMAVEVTVQDVSIERTENKFSFVASAGFDESEASTEKESAGSKQGALKTFGSIARVLAFNMHS